MNNQKQYIKKILINIYGFKHEELNSKSKDELEKLLHQKENEKMEIIKNPNKFWYIKGMPHPKFVQPNKSKKGGIWIIISLFFVLIGFLIIFMIIAFMRN